MSAANETVSEALRSAIAKLTRAGVPSAARDARRLMAAALRIAPSRLTLHSENALAPDVDQRFRSFVDQRLTRRPVSQILGEREFFGRRFQITEKVLDPRPETETLIAAALAEPFDTVLDAGTGSGCILLTLLAERQNSLGLGTDLSEAALEVARQNAAALGVAGRCRFQLSDWFGSVIGKFDLLVSNPPYIAITEMADLSPELSYEPRMALTDEADGLSVYRAIAASAGNHLNTGGRLLLEIGHKQGADVHFLLRSHGFERLEVLPDLDGRDRVVSGYLP